MDLENEFMTINSVACFMEKRKEISDKVSFLLLSVLVS